MDRAQPVVGSPVHAWPDRCSFRTVPSTITDVADYASAADASGDGTLAVDQSVRPRRAAGAARVVRRDAGRSHTSIDSIASRRPSTDSPTLPRRRSRAPTATGRCSSRGRSRRSSPGRHTLDLRFRANGTIAMDGGPGRLRLAAAANRPRLSRRARVGSADAAGPQARIDHAAVGRRLGVRAAAEAGGFAASRRGRAPDGRIPSVATRFSAEGLPFPDPHWSVIADRAPTRAGVLDGGRVPAGGGRRGARDADAPATSAGGRRPARRPPRPTRRRRRLPRPSRRAARACRRGCWRRPCSTWRAAGVCDSSRRSGAEERRAGA